MSINTYLEYQNSIIKTKVIIKTSKTWIYCILQSIWRVNDCFLSLLMQDLPEILRKLARRADIYTKHYLFHHMNLTDDPNTENKINIVLNHIEKFTDTQVFDVKIEKPSETIQFRRVPTTVLQPMSSVYSKVQTVLMKLSNNTYPRK